MSARGRIVGSCLWWLACCAPLAAQDPFRAMPSRLLKELGEQLSLTDAQKRQVVALKQDFEKKHAGELKDLRRDVRRVREVIRDARNRGDSAGLKKAQTQAKTLRQTAAQLDGEFQAGFLGLLTDAQREEYAGLRGLAASTAGLRGKSALPANKKH